MKALRVPGQRQCQSTSGPDLGRIAVGGQALAKRFARLLAAVGKGRFLGGRDGSQVQSDGQGCEPAD